MGKEPFTTELDELIAIRNLLSAGISTDITPITSVVGEVDDAADETVGITATIVSYIKGLINALVRKTSSQDFWSASVETFTVPAVAADTALPDVTIPASGSGGLPTGATLVRVQTMFKYRKVSAVAASALTGAQDIQVRTDAPGAWADAINLVDNQWTLAAGAEEGGDVVIGNIDVKATVTGADTYNFQLDEAVADSALVFNGIQVGLRVWYR